MPWKSLQRVCLAQLLVWILSILVVLIDPPLGTGLVKESEDHPHKQVSSLFISCASFASPYKSDYFFKCLHEYINRFVCFCTALQCLQVFTGLTKHHLPKNKLAPWVSKFPLSQHKKHDRHLGFHTQNLANRPETAQITDQIFNLKRPGALGRQ